MRRINTRGEGRTNQLDIAFNTLFVSELLAPSREIWLVSAWLSDIPVVDNRAGEVLALVPGAPLRELRLLELLDHAVGAGTNVSVVVRRNPSNAGIAYRLRSMATRHSSPRLHVHETDTIHDKLLLTDRFLLEGSMNLTHFGQRVNEEGVTISTDVDLIARQRLELRSRYGGGQV